MWQPIARSSAIFAVTLDFVIFQVHRKELFGFETDYLSSFVSERLCALAPHPLWLCGCMGPDAYANSDGPHQSGPTRCDTTARNRTTTARPRTGSTDDHRPDSASRHTASRTAGCTRHRHRSRYGTDARGHIVTDRCSADTITGHVRHNDRHSDRLAGTSRAGLSGCAAATFAGSAQPFTTRRDERQHSGPDIE